MDLQDVNQEDGVYKYEIIGSTSTKGPKAKKNVGRSGSDRLIKRLFKAKAQYGHFRAYEGQIIINEEEEEEELKSTIKE